MSIRFGASTFLLAAAFAAACASGPARESKLHTVTVGDGSDTLVVMLPGIKDRAEQFIVAGFVGDDAATEPFDVLVVEPEVGHYLRGTLVDRLHMDVIEPARYSLLTWAGGACHARSPRRAA